MYDNYWIPIGKNIGDDIDVHIQGAVSEFLVRIHSDISDTRYSCLSKKKRRKPSISAVLQRKKKRIQILLLYSHGY